MEIKTNIWERAACPWPHIIMYLSLTNYIAKHILFEFVPVSYAQHFSVYFFFLLFLFYSKIIQSLLLNWIVQPYLILLDSIHMCGILKFNPQLKIVISSSASFVARSQFVYSVFSYSLFEIPNRSSLDFTFVVVEISSILLEISPIICWHYAFCFPAPIIPKIMLA